MHRVQPFGQFGCSSSNSFLLTASIQSLLLRTLEAGGALHLPSSPCIPESNLRICGSAPPGERRRWAAEGRRRAPTETDQYPVGMARLLM